MAFRDPTAWMWEEALEVLDQAERLHRRFFSLHQGHQLCPNWEPPVDVFENDTEVLVLVALPGVLPEQVQITTEETILVIRGERLLPGSVRQARISRLEIPHGRFERRIELPPGQYRLVDNGLRDGCLILTLSKLARSG